MRSLFQQPAPKSTGKDYFNLSWLDRYLEDFPGLATEDVQATLVDLTIQSIAQVLNQLPMQRLLVCGGGVHNPLLITRLNQVLAPCPVESTEDHGIDPDWVEACCFAWLAQQRLQQKPGNLPQVTGARQPLILGGVYMS
ncbi:anhydro-N-acetylmuramic acid kinase [Candidatus Venteria ishoeyi]|uniref:anhydro-N-acetylmuramic acid kinase n=1 Tax=Candidatus Venteria ishoeyi TaxID=1899563 RepID=UPI00255C6D5C|nr:anhydro-N-acetylmuramic acid kinase [Candidatus Venteria ishoeyi]